MDEDSASPDDQRPGEGGPEDTDRATGRHRPRRREQWTMTGSTPRPSAPARLLARLRDLLLGRTVRPLDAGARGPGPAGVLA